MNIEVNGGFLRVEGTEASVVRRIAQRQELGIKKYGTSVRANDLPLKQWLLHALEEALDQAIYLQRAIEEIERYGEDLK